MARILIVDDDMEVRALIKHYLTREGYTCLEAAHGAQALDLLRSYAYELVIMDRTMPKMTGVQTLRVLRGQPKHAKLKVLICTSSSISGDVDEAFAAGASGYILKPINPDRLVEKVRSLLAG